MGTRKNARLLARGGKRRQTATYTMIPIFDGSLCVQVTQPDGHTFGSPELRNLEDARRWILRHKRQARLHSK